MSDTRLVGQPEPAPPSWQTCRDCAASTFRCPAHSSWFEVIPAIVIVPESVFVPTTIIQPLLLWSR